MAMMAVCVICKLKFENFVDLNEHYITAHTQHNNCDKFRIIGYQIVEYNKPVDTLDSVVIPHSNGNTVEDITDQQKPRPKELVTEEISYTRCVTDEQRRASRKEYQRKRRERMTVEQRMDINKKRRDRDKRKRMEINMKRKVRSACFTTDEQRRAAKNACERKQRARLTDEQRIDINKKRKAKAKKKRMDRIRDDQLLELRTAKEKEVCYNDKQILVLKVGKDRAIQLSDDIDKEVKKCVDSDVEYLSGNEYEDKHSVDNDIDFDSIISNVIENIESISVLNEITNANIKPENKDFNSVCFNANNEQIEIILPTITPKQLNSSDQKNNCNLMNNLLKCIIQRKLLIELNLKFLKHMCERMGLRGIESLNTQQMVRHEDIYACFWPHCNATFKMDKALTYHLKLNHYRENGILQLNNDNNNNSNESDVKFENTYIIQTDCDQKIYVCCKCDEKFPNVHHLYDHIITHIDKPFMCDFCDNRFDSINELLSHRDYTHFRRKFLCDVCDYKSGRKQLMINHKLKVHGKFKRSGKQQNFICTEYECGKMFTARYHLIHHQMIVHSGKRYECVWPECGASFKSYAYLNHHLRLHSGVNTFRCDFPECNGKTFVTKFTLDSHVKYIHNDDRPFTCDWPDCCARFKTNTQLWIHTNVVHNKKRKFKCPYCDYKGHKLLLYMHKKRVHEKVKKFVCDIPECNGKRFHAKQQLNDHKSSVHSDKRPFVCDWPQCNKAYKLKQVLKNHIKKAHTLEIKSKS